MICSRQTDSPLNLMCSSDTIHYKLFSASLALTHHTVNALYKIVAKSPCFPICVAKLYSLAQLMPVSPGSTFGSVQTHFLQTPSLSCCTLLWVPSDWSRMQTHHLMNLADLKAGLILSHWRTSLHIPGLSREYN